MAFRHRPDGFLAPDPINCSMDAAYCLPSPSSSRAWLAPADERTARAAGHGLQLDTKLDSTFQQTTDPFLDPHCYGVRLPVRRRPADLCSVSACAFPRDCPVMLPFDNKSESVVRHVDRRCRGTAALHEIGAEPYSMMSSITRSAAAPPA